MGATLGVTVMGVIVNHGLPPGVQTARASAIHRLPPAARKGLADAIHPAFLAAALVSVAVWVIAVLLREGAAAAALARRDLGRRGGSGHARRRPQ